MGARPWVKCQFLSTPQLQAQGFSIFGQYDFGNVQDLLDESQIKQHYQAFFFLFNFNGFGICDGRFNAGSGLVQIDVAREA
jgi:hypothetical protein